MKTCRKKAWSAMASLFAAGFFLGACTDHGAPGSPGVPEPIKVLENPRTGERARFFAEIGYKTPRGYDANKHLAEWVAAKAKAGFTQEISPAQDRPALAEMRARNRANQASRVSPGP